MSIQDQIEEKIRNALKPEYLDVINESYMHNVPPGSESHFKVIIVSADFEDMGKVQRHQRMNSILAEELAGPVHALSMETLTTLEWKARGRKKFTSPPCHGGSNSGD